MISYAIFLYVEIIEGLFWCPNSNSVVGAVSLLFFLIKQITEDIFVDMLLISSSWQ